MSLKRKHNLEVVSKDIIEEEEEGDLLHPINDEESDGDESGWETDEDDENKNGENIDANNSQHEDTNSLSDSDYGSSAGRKINKLKNKEKISSTLKNVSKVKKKSGLKRKLKSLPTTNSNLNKSISKLLDTAAEDDEYAGTDSSDEEDLRNTIGNVPINWYDEYPHLGYNLDADPIMKPAQKDTLDKFLDKMENPDFYRTVIDKQTGQNVRLSDGDLDIAQRIIDHKVPDKSYDMYAPFLDLYSHEVSEMPLSGRPEHKRSFVPSKSERAKVVRMAMIMRHKRLFGVKPKQRREKPKYYDIWKPRGEEEGRIRRVAHPIRAPKMPLPTTEESYNPPPEYMMTRRDEEKLMGAGDPNHPLFRRLLTYRSKTIREIPAYGKAVQERFERLMDLYITPRKKTNKLVATSQDFLPKLPPKKDLRPYPTMEAICYKGHRSIIRTISVHPNGKFLASGSDDHTVKIWEVDTGRCLRSFTVEDAVKVVAWNPNPKLFMLGVVFGNQVVCLSPETYLTDRVVLQQTNTIFREAVEQGDYIVPERIKTAVTWRKPTEDEWLKGYRLIVEHFKPVAKLIWHRQGDYFATVVPEGAHRAVMMHQLSRWRTQVPFNKSKGRVQTVAFHPKLPQLFVVTQTNVRLYDLQKQKLIKKIQCNSRWVSSVAVHPSGEHFVIGGYDRRVNWFEMEYTKRPHLMRYHTGAVRGVAFHRKYPMFATCSDDGKTVVSHSMVYEDWLKDPLIVPLKQLRGHRKFSSYYGLDVTWHPHEPFLFTAGADATIRLWN